MRAGEITEIRMIDKNLTARCLTCKHCTEYQIIFRCYQCKLDWHDINYTKHCDNYEKE